MSDEILRIKDANRNMDSELSVEIGASGCKLIIEWNGGKEMIKFWLNRETWELLKDAIDLQGEKHLGYW